MMGWEKTATCKRDSIMKPTVEPYFPDKNSAYIMRHFLLAWVSCIRTDFCSVNSPRVLDMGETQCFLYWALVGSNPADDLVRRYQHLSPLNRSFRCSAAATHSSKLSSWHMVHWCLHTSLFICHNSSYAHSSWCCYNLGLQHLSLQPSSALCPTTQGLSVCLSVSYGATGSYPHNSPQSLKVHSVITSRVTVQTRSLHSPTFSGPVPIPLHFSK